MLSSVFIRCHSLRNWEGLHRHFLLQQEGSVGDVWVIRSCFARVKREEELFPFISLLVGKTSVRLIFRGVMPHEGHLTCYFLVWRDSKLELFPKLSLGCAWGQDSLARLDAGT